MYWQFSDKFLYSCIFFSRWNAHTALVSRGNVQQDYMNATGQIRDIRQHMLDVAVTLGESYSSSDLSIICWDQEYSKN